MTSKYTCKTRKGFNVPWGYKVHPDDDHLFLPIDDMLDAYYEAKELIKQGCSLRETAKWLSEETGVPITHVGLYLKIKQEEKQKRSAIAKRAWERKFGKEQGSETVSEG